MVGLRSRARDISPPGADCSAGARAWGGAVRSDARAVLGRCCERDGTRCVEEERGVRGGARGAVAAAARLCAAEVHGWHALEQLWVGAGRRMLATQKVHVVPIYEWRHLLLLIERFRRLQAKSARRRPKAHVVGGGNIILDPTSSLLAHQSGASSTSSRRERTHRDCGSARCAAEESGARAFRGGAWLAASQMRPPSASRRCALTTLK